MKSLYHAPHDLSHTNLLPDRGTDGHYTEVSPVGDPVSQ